MIIQLDNGILQAKIHLLGAELISLCKDKIEYLCVANKPIWDRQAPILFPNVGCIKDGYVLINEKKYLLPQHGFAKDSVFSCIEHSQTSATFMLESSLETIKLYPWKFRLLVRYTLEDNCLHISISVWNDDCSAMYYSCGFHPGFKCPLMPEETAEMYHITFSPPMTANRLVMKNALVVENQPKFLNSIWKLPLQEGMFDGGSYTLTDLTSYNVTLSNQNAFHSVTVGSKGFNQLVLWAPPKEPFSYICIEPWCGMADWADSNHNFETKQGNAAVLPGKSDSKEIFIMLT